MDHTPTYIHSWEDEITPKDLALRDFLRSQGRIPADAILNRVHIVFDTWSSGFYHETDAEVAVYPGYDPSKFDKDDFPPVTVLYCGIHKRQVFGTKSFPDGYHELFPELCKNKADEYSMVQEKLERNGEKCEDCQQLRREQEERSGEDEERMRLVRKRHDSSDDCYSLSSPDYKRQRHGRSRSHSDPGMDVVSSPQNPDLLTMETNGDLTKPSYRINGADELQARSSTSNEYTELPLSKPVKESAQVHAVSSSFLRLQQVQAPSHTGFETSSLPEHKVKEQLNSQENDRQTVDAGATPLHPARGTSSLLNSEPEHGDTEEICVFYSDHEISPLLNYSSSPVPASRASDEDEPIPSALETGADEFMENTHSLFRASESNRERNDNWLQDTPGRGRSLSAHSGLHRERGDSRTWKSDRENKHGHLNTRRSRSRHRSEGRNHRNASGSRGGDSDRESDDACNRGKSDRSVFDHSGYDREGYHRNGYDHEGYNHEGYDRDGYDRNGYDREGWMRHWNQGRGLEPQWPPTSNNHSSHTPPGYEHVSTSRGSDTRPTVDECTFPHEEITFECNQCGFGSAFPNLPRDTLRRPRRESRSRSRHTSPYLQHERQSHSERGAQRPHSYRKHNNAVHGSIKEDEIRSAKVALRCLLMGNWSESFSSSVLKALDEEQAGWEQRWQAMNRCRDDGTDERSFKEALTDLIMVLQDKHDELH